MSVIVSLLFFAAISTTAALVLCLFFGTLTSAIAWISLIAGALFGVYVYATVKKVRLEPQPRNFFDWLMLFFFSCFLGFFLPLFGF